MLFPFRDNNPTRTTPVVTYALVAANVVAYLGLSALPPRQEQMAVLAYGFIPARIGQLVEPKAITIEVPRARVRTPWGIVEEKERFELPPARGQVLLSLLTSMFLHGGWSHLIGNLWYLWIFGDNVEDVLGHAGFLVFYLVCGVVASLLHYLTGPLAELPMVGASGAIAAVLGAYIVAFPRARVFTLLPLFPFFQVVPLPAFFVLGLWFLLQFVLGLGVLGAAGTGGIAFWAHIGGFASGWLTMWVVLSRRRSRGRAE